MIGTNNVKGKSIPSHKSNQIDVKEVLYKTGHHFFPSFVDWLNQIPDPRQKGRIYYPLSSLIWIGILLFMMKLESRRQINFQFNTPEFTQNLNLLAKVELEEVAHDGTLAYLLQRLNIEAIFNS